MLISNENLRKFSLYVKGTKKNAKDLVVFFKGPVKEILVIEVNEIHCVFVKYLRISSA